MEGAELNNTPSQLSVTTLPLQAHWLKATIVGRSWGHGTTLASYIRKTGVCNFVSSEDLLRSTRSISHTRSHSATHVKALYALARRSNSKAARCAHSPLAQSQPRCAADSIVSVARPTSRAKSSDQKWRPSSQHTREGTTSGSRSVTLARKGP